MRTLLLDRFLDPKVDRRRRPLVSTLVLATLQVAVQAFLAVVAGPVEIIGLAGAVAALIAVVAGIFVGVRSGVVVAIVGMTAFFVFVSDLGSATPLVSTLLAGGVWIAAAVLAGLVADSLRREILARRVDREEVASLQARLGRNLLPNVPEVVGGCRVITLYRPGEERIELGGDFYDVFALRDGTLAMIIGDVSGHGPDAAGLAAMLRAAWQSLVYAQVEPETLVEAMTEILRREMAAPDSFATVCMAHIDPAARSVSLLDLGHPPPFLIGSDVRPLTVKPLLPLGVVTSPDIRTTTTALPEHWSLFFYTDGLIEGRTAPDSAERYGEERLAARLLSECGGGGAMFEAAACLDTLVSDIELAHGGQLPDDVAVVVISS